MLFIPQATGGMASPHKVVRAYDFCGEVRASNMQGPLSTLMSTSSCLFLRNYSGLDHTIQIRKRLPITEVQYTETGDKALQASIAISRPLVNSHFQA